MFTWDSGRTFIDSVLELREEGELEVSLVSIRRLGTRFNACAISQHGLKFDVTVTLTCRIGQKKASLSLNETRDRDVLQRAVKQVTALARNMPDDPEVMPFNDQKISEKQSALSEATEQLDIPILGTWVAEACRAGTAANVDLAGILTVKKGLCAWGSSTGGFAAERQHSTDFHVTATGEHGSGWAEHQGLTVTRDQVMAATERAIDKCLRSQNPIPEPAEPTVAILEPQAVGDLLMTCFWSWDQRATDEGRSAFSEGPDKIGDLTLWSDPEDSRNGAVPFTLDGEKLERQVWLDKGVPQQQVTSRYWAQKTGVASKPRPNNLILEGAGTPVDDMISSTENGILVTRFWYIRYVDPRTMTLTGMTRDGIWRVIDGEVTRPLVDYRWNDSAFRILQNVLDSGEPTPTGEFMGMIMPALKIDEFRFASLSGAI